jgi:hypothetical protein
MSLQQLLSSCNINRSYILKHGRPFKPCPPLVHALRGHHASTLGKQVAHAGNDAGAKPRLQALPRVSSVESVCHASILEAHPDTRAQVHSCRKYHHCYIFHRDRQYQMIGPRPVLEVASTGWTDHWSRYRSSGRRGGRQQCHSCPHPRHCRRCPSSMAPHSHHSPRGWLSDHKWHPQGSIRHCSRKQCQCRDMAML